MSDSENHQHEQQQQQQQQSSLIPENWKEIADLRLALLQQEYEECLAAEIKNKQPDQFEGLAQVLKNLESVSEAEGWQDAVQGFNQEEEVKEQYIRKANEGANSSSDEEDVEEEEEDY